MSQIVRRARGRYTVTETVSSDVLWERMMQPFTIGATTRRSLWISRMFWELEPKEDGAFIGRGTLGGLYPIKLVASEPGNLLAYRWGGSLNPPPRTKSDTVEFIHADYTFQFLKQPGLVAVDGEYTEVFRRLRSPGLRVRIFGHKEFPAPQSYTLKEVLGRIPANGHVENVRDLE